MPNKQEKKLLKAWKQLLETQQAILDKLEEIRVLLKN